MIQYPANQFWWLAYDLTRLEEELGEQPVCKALAAELMAVMAFAQLHCGEFGFSDTAMLPLSTIKAAVERFNLQIPAPDVTDDVKRELKNLRKNIELELGKRHFAYVPQEYEKFFEKSALFGDGVFVKFEAARQDLVDAGNCLAMSLPTACVFHLMRVGEYGLRKLAKKLRVRLTHTGKGSPIEYADWGKLIAAVRNKIAEARKLPAGPRRQARLEAYSNAADHCEYMKDIWRNNVAHARKSYKESEAIAAFERVRYFMVFLEKHV